MIRRLMSRSALVLAALLPLALSGCSELLGLETSIEGTYTLVEINGTSLPYRLAYVDANNRLMTESGSATVSAGGTYTSVARGYMVVNGNRSPWTERHTGTWEENGSSYRFTQENGRTATTSFGSGTMVMDQNNNTLKFEKN